MQINKSMWLFVFLLILFSFKAVNAQAFNYFEFENLMSFQNSTAENRPEVNVFGQYLSQDGMIGSYFYAEANKFWGEAYGGILYKPTDFLSTYYGIGVEENAKVYRVNFAAFINEGKFSLTQWYEYGGSGFWYDITANYDFTKAFEAGIIYKRYYGLGLNTWIRIPDSFLSFNIAPVYDFEFKTARLMTIARFSF
jgi:hypothetical protein